MKRVYKASIRLNLLKINKIRIIIINSYMIYQISSRHLKYILNVFKYLFHIDKR